MMKRLIFSIIIAFTFAIGCEKEGDKLIVSDPGTPGDFSASPSELTLSATDTEALAMTFAWNDGAMPELSDPTIAMPDGIVQKTIQFSSSEDFASFEEIELEEEQASIQFTVDALSKLLIKLGLTDVKQYNVYARLAICLGKDYTFSETIIVKITPFKVETGWMQIVDRYDKTKVIATLHANASNPKVYEGFAAVSGWQNVFFIEADGTEWGCNADWTAYSIAANSGNNIWFAEPAGCQWVTIDTQNAFWSQVYIPEVKVNLGGTEIIMQYSKSANGFSAEVTTTSDNTTFTAGGTGSRYDISGGDKTAVDNPFSFIPEGGNGFTFLGESNATEAFTIPTAGTYKLVFNIVDNTWSVSTGSSDGESEVSYPESASLYYYYKKASEQLALACEMSETDTEGIFEGFIYTDPNWGTHFSNFRIVTENAVYGANADQFAMDEAGWNMWSSNTEMNYIEADFTTMSWKETKVTKIAVSGDFNEWSLDSDPLTFNMETGKWEAICDISTIGYGFKIVLDDANEAWRWKYADTDLDGTMSLVGDSDNTVPSATGKYKIELELTSFAAPKCTMTPIE